jgi:hypothetical protein
MKAGKASRQSAPETGLAHLKRLPETRILTRFGPFFTAAAKGGDFCLSAMGRFEAVMTQINAPPGAADDYGRAHRLEIWSIPAQIRRRGLPEPRVKSSGRRGLECAGSPGNGIFAEFRVTP